jgi:uncharacterized protein
MATEYIVLNLVFAGQEYQNQYVLTLVEKEGKLAFTMLIHFFDAQLIAMELEKVKNPRPLTHDLFKTVMDSHKIKLSKVEIVDIEDGIFHAQISLNTGKVIDCRPSDAIILALKYKVPIEIYDNVCEEVCFELDDIPEAVAEGEETQDPELPKIELKDIQKLDLDARVPVNNELDNYRKLLDEAILDEDFESAAKYRDKVRELELKLRK